MKTLPYLKFRVEYIFNNSKFGFSNSVTVEAQTPEQAKNKAHSEIELCYGSQMAKRFSLKEPLKIN